MATKTERLEARVSPAERAHIERAAEALGLSVSAFLIATAIERADEIVAADRVMVVPAEWFDEFVATLDRAEPAPRLAAAARRARRDARIITP